MTRAEAVGIIWSVCKPERQPNQREFRRLMRAMETLGLSTSEKRAACRHLDIVNKDGVPWRADLRQITPWSAS